MIPPLLSVALLERRVELVLDGGRRRVGVVVYINPSRGLLCLREVGERRPNGTWQGKGAVQTLERPAIRQITVLDKDPAEPTLDLERLPGAFRAKLRPWREKERR